MKINEESNGETPVDTEMLDIFSKPLSLMFSCKKAIWTKLGGRFAIDCKKLTLPSRLLNYLADINQV